jgi:hypothetical protein
MSSELDDPSFLVGAVLHELATDAEALLLIASALEDRATGISSTADPQKLREAAALVKSAALQAAIAAANLVGAAERLRFAAELAELGSMGRSDLPS